ncbi:hypothetical protein B0T17DRAFT_513719 [Bombardia bombarda]|uniref:Uncharacterized protein n=1 Tax=Bombardia bombarda TaxID=252184 RepID=A0AA39XK84_9PEZI|nr:hypothetical protein B0T17DRAFT_513719 [Bombardia bombarda]
MACSGSSDGVSQQPPPYTTNPGSSGHPRHGMQMLGWEVPHGLILEHLDPPTPRAVVS